ncbi:hypothetical protein CTI12_AA057740 [Artemisia annua]|uniref:Non-haem dioxygenase N-terminal domain-containing protein n=1 Tax=Artemisia annua TaxID=35608 RepID=A0A2U1NQI3_ARTAN|nr:hypothetical protein CTI12_AA057740 [Artemisia annua]
MSNSLDFRAPPPSPVGPGRRSTVANDDILTDFLHQTLIVPDLVLPDRVFPRQNPNIQSLPKLDFKKFSEDCKVDEVIEVIAQTGCFELVNHGISSKLLRDVKECGKGVFGLEDEKKRVVLRSNERLYGFVDVNGDDKDVSEEFVWCRDESLRSEMEGVWTNYTDFSEKMESLMSKIENISESLLKLFLDPSTPKSRLPDDSNGDKETMGSMCYLYKHSKNMDNLSNDDEYMDSLSYDVIRMLIRGSEHKHTLCFHVCDGSSEFHVYSKKGWVSFSPDKNALVGTIGDQLQTWSEGKYKHVIGRPIFKGELADCISMAFLYSPPISRGQEDNTISLDHRGFIGPMTPPATDKGKNKMYQYTDKDLISDELLCEIENNDISLLNEQYGCSYFAPSSLSPIRGQTNEAFNIYPTIRQDNARVSSVAPTLAEGQGSSSSMPEWPFPSTPSVAPRSSSRAGAGMPSQVRQGLMLSSLLTQCLKLTGDTVQKQDPIEQGVSGKVLQQHTCIWTSAIKYAVTATLFSGSMNA